MYDAGGTGLSSQDSHAPEVEPVACLLGISPHLSVEARPQAHRTPGTVHAVAFNDVPTLIDGHARAAVCVCGKRQVCAGGIMQHIWPCKGSCVFSAVNKACACAGGVFPRVHRRGGLCLCGPRLLPGAPGGHLRGGPAEHPVPLRAAVQGRARGSLARALRWRPLWR